MKSKSFNFQILTKDNKSKARAGVISTPHGIVETPNFITVGTQATVKSLTPQDLKEIGVQILFGNTYHLHLRPGEDIVQEFGGLGKFMNWEGVTITDSGGFQVFSLGKKKKSLRSPRQFENSSNASIPAVASGDLGIRRVKRGLVKNVSYDEAPRDFVIDVNLSSDPCESPALVKVTDDGVTFRSHIDGSLHIFTPEESIKIQQKLGADIILAFDECAPHPFTHEKTKKAMERTHEWAVRSLEYQKSNIKDQKFRQALYGIVQGGVYQDLRGQSAKFISELAFDGIAIGGVSVGESKKQMREAVDWVVPFLPEEKPRHLLGIGEIDDLFDGVERGMDTFDCVLPTRFGRYGMAFVGSKESEDPPARLDESAKRAGKAGKGKFRINLNRSIYAKDKRPIAKDCLCSTCQNYTRGYLNHLFRAQELLGYHLVSYHNLYFIINLMKQIRQSILEDRFNKLKKSWLEN